VTARRVFASVLFSVLVHAALALALRMRPHLPAPEPRPRTLEVRMFELPPEPEKIPPPPEQAPPEPPKPEPPQKAKPAPAPKPEQTEPPLAEKFEAPAASEPPDVPAPLALLDASIQAAAFGVATSTALDAPGGISRGRSEPPPAAVPAPSAALAPFTPLGDLSRKPRPPSLDALLRKNYPEPLRRRGVDGQATVRANVTPRGRVARVDTVSESAPGFADACKRTLLGSEWTEPFDRDGNRVATQLTYRCRFEIER
jgi:periplasmic protein TonB